MVIMQETVPQLYSHLDAVGGTPHLSSTFRTGLRSCGAQLETFLVRPRQ